MRTSAYFCAAALALNLAACGSSTSSSVTIPQAMMVFTDSATSTSYNITYYSSTAPVTGKNQFMLEITRLTNGAHVSGATVTIEPEMHMNDGMNHTTPVGALTDNGDGTYSGAVYYLMAASMNGQSLGEWHLHIMVNGEAAVFNPDVTMSMGDTARATLKLASDKYLRMGVATARSWYLFHNGLEGSGGSYTFSVFAAVLQDLMTMPGVTGGMTLPDDTGANWTVNSVAVEVSTDAVTWSAMTAKGGGVYEAAVTGLRDGMAGTVYVRLTVNGTQYTTDGAAASGANGYGTFTVTPGGMSAM
ncbi:MAG: FixH family protein [Nitrospinae bacterium]|nr:FixH family protein [Nitrospinota bacterium]